MKYFVTYPIAYDCNLRCNYCYHRKHFETNYTMDPGFTVDQYKKFRNTHLLPAEDIIIHFHGGEPFLESNIRLICDVMSRTDIERFDILTNGIQDREYYGRLFHLFKKIYRVGFTYHRDLIDSIPEMKKRFESNVKYLHDNGFSVYVKELLIVGNMRSILIDKERWRRRGIKHKVQFLKKFSNADLIPTSKRHLSMLDLEYYKCGDYCSCKSGYKNVLIGGHIFGGNVFACFQDMKIVGNINRNEYNPNYTIRQKKKGQVEVEGVPPVYSYDKLYRDGGSFRTLGCGYE